MENDWCNIFITFQLSFYHQAWEEKTIICQKYRRRILKYRYAVEDYGQYSLSKILYLHKEIGQRLWHSRQNDLFQH